MFFSFSKKKIELKILTKIIYKTYTWIRLINNTHYYNNNRAALCFKKKNLEGEKLLADWTHVKDPNNNGVCVRRTEYRWSTAVCKPVYCSILYHDSKTTDILYENKPNSLSQRLLDITLSTRTSYTFDVCFTGCPSRT